ncbi:DUF4333 domain-containing protein [Corynebacterium aquatimens]
MPLFTLTGCTGSVPKNEVETQIADQLEAQVGQRPDSIECPGDLEAKEGATMRCTLSAGDTKYGVDVQVTKAEGGKAEFDIQVDDAPMN